MIDSPAVLAGRVSAWVGGREANIEYAGLVGAGLYQFNLRVPELPAGDQPVQIRVEDAFTPPGLQLRIGK